MRIFPVALIVIGSLGLAKHFGLIPVGLLQVAGPVLLIALGAALLFRVPRGCRGTWRAHRGDASSAAQQPPSAGAA